MNPFWHDVFFKDGITTATWVLALATGGLIVANFVQLYTNWRQNDQERARWSQERERREFNAAPKAEFGLQISDGSQLELWCANLGTTSFLITSLRMITATHPSSSIVVPLSPIIVPIGKISRARLSTPDLSIALYRNCEVSLELQGQEPLSKIETKTKPYSILVYGHEIAKLDPCFTGIEPLNCPKCSERIANLDMNGLRTIEDFQKERLAIENEYSKTCPLHFSKSTRIKALKTVVGQIQD